MKKLLLIAIMSILLLISCDQIEGLFKNPSTDDTENPTVSSLNITPSEITSNSLVLTWELASDNITEQNDLLYKVEQSVNSTTTVLLDWVANKSTLNLTDLTEVTEYVYSVKVKDQAGNELSYNTLTQDTPHIYEGVWEFYQESEDGSNSNHYLFTIEKNSIKLRIEETEDYQIELIMDLTVVDDKMTFSPNQARNLPDGEFLEDTDSPELTMFYSVDKDNIIFYEGDETSSNIASWILTRQGFEESSYNDGESIVGRWGWSTTSIIYNDDGSFEQLEGDQVQAKGNYEVLNNNKKYKLNTTHIWDASSLKELTEEEKIDYATEGDLYLVDGLMCQDPGYGIDNTKYIYKKR
ncbi:hypothetical protein EW093_05505 [Thiospirochaeta perfilievii]|uniref:Fibronectin type-III domain-containing protein n=1 Tax=Thiospirochaeta perfilievii TaxID=252967 RepID=A0A5C1Q9M2_9SPIO|nr:fibronectin type III domain-containing protein [Thiospirochaeta perfilievii]QEN04181.1 hypothetical protein EW093_05505 [Thiospirochaeta perfilievii]